MHNISNQDTHLYTTTCAQQLISFSEDHNRSTTLWAHHQWNGDFVVVLSGWKTLQDSVLSFSTSAHTLPEWPWPEQHGSGLTASAPMSDISILLTQMGYGPFCDLWVWCRRTDRRPCCPLSNPLTSPWTTRPEGSEWWDNRMAAQHLHLDLVRPSSGLKELLMRWRRTNQL